MTQTGPKPPDTCPCGRQKRGTVWSWGQKLQGCGHQKPEGTGPWGPTDTDVRLPAPEWGGGGQREHISVVVSLQVYGHLLERPQEAGQQPHTHPRGSGPQCVPLWDRT